MNFDDTRGERARPTGRKGKCESGNRVLLKVPQNSWWFASVLPPEIGRINRAQPMAPWFAETVARVSLWDSQPAILVGQVRGAPEWRPTKRLPEKVHQAGCRSWWLNGAEYGARTCQFSSHHHTDWPKKIWGGEVQEVLEAKLYQRTGKSPGRDKISE
jgi:hypothetical protein